MNPNKSHDERQVYRPRANDEQRKSIGKNNAGCHYAKHHGYADHDFVEQGEIVQFNGIRVIDTSGSSESKEFESFIELNNSQWTISGASGIPLSDGTLLYEVRQ